MNPTLDAELCALAPKLYRNRYSDPRATAMCWGFECGDGWFDLLKEASVKLEALINALPEAEQEHCYATQVKEKFGTLRFYLAGYPDGANEVIHAAEKRSAKECEQCGARARNGSVGGWCITRCRAHLRGRR